MQHGFLFQILAYAHIEFTQRLNLTFFLSRISFFLDLDMMFLTSFYTICVETCKANLHCMIIVLAKMSQTNGSKLREQLQG
jgi:hypothetical protein